MEGQEMSEATRVRFLDRCTFEGSGEVYSVPAGAVGVLVERSTLLGEPVWTVRLSDGRHVSVLPGEVEVVIAEATDAE